MTDSVRIGISNQRPIDSIIVHCSDSADDQTWIDAAEIGRWHKARGFRTIGYHFVIKKDGTVEIGRALNSAGAHCKGFNLFSVGVCWVGRHDCNPRQRAALVKLLKDLLKQFKLSEAQIYGHSHFDPNKTCPNISIPDLRRDVAAAV
jgi:N-acetylmuramoyl-L-alanine amidase